MLGFRIKLKTLRIYFLKIIFEYEYLLKRENFNSITRTLDIF